MLDHKISKPSSIRGYSIHRMVAELCDGVPYQFVDRGDHLIIRTEKRITDSAANLREVISGEVLAFELRASVAIRRGGKNLYPEIGDWRARRQWLEERSERHGFILLAVHVTDERLEVRTTNERKFWIDSTDFTGVLKVTQVDAFSKTLQSGIGRVGKAFGMGMLII